MRTRRIVFWAAVLIVLGFGFVTAGPEQKAAQEKAKKLWTADDIILAESASDWNISPDGRRAVWVKSHLDKDKNGRVSNLFLTDLETKKEFQLTQGSENHSQPAWSPDGQTIAFLSKRPLPKAKAEDKDEEKGAGPQLWLMSLAGGEPYPLTESIRDISRFKWLDEGTIVFSAKEDPALFEKEREKIKDDTQAVDDTAHEPPVRLYKLKVKDKKVSRLTDNIDFISQWDVSPDGKQAVTVNQQYLSYEWDQKLLPKTYLCDLASGTRREILAGQRIVPGDVKWATDRSGFYMAAPYSTDPRFFQATVTVLYFYDLKTDKHYRVDLGWENGLEGGVEVTPDGFLTLLQAGVRLIPARYVKNGLAWKRTDLAGDQVKNFFDFAVDPAAKTVVFSCSAASRPEQWFRAKLEGSRLTNSVQVTDLNSGFKDRPIARAEVVRWKGALGQEVEGLLYYPHDYQPGKKYPLFTAPHGGPLGADLDAWYEGFDYPQQLLCQRGAFVLKPNYHGSSNYGLAFAESISGGTKYYDLPVEDIEKGVDALIAQGLVDPDRIGTFGWSNGSILSIALCLANPDRYKVLGAGAGDVEWISDWANVDFGQAFDTYYLGKSPLEDPQLYLRISPLFKMDKMKAPTIIFFGTEDRNVPTSQGWTHYRALYHLDKVPVKFLLFPGEPHGLRTYAHQRRKVDEEMAWFDRYFFKSEKAENEALKKDSPLAQVLRRNKAAHSGGRFGVAWKPASGEAAGGAAAETLIPETVKRGNLEVGRFEVTRAQYAAFDPAYLVEAGRDNYPANNIPFEKAKAYAEWLSKLTGQVWRLPFEDEVTSLYEDRSEENTLDYWAGYALNPDDARRLELKVKELGGVAALLREVGSFKALGEETEEPVFDLGGNVAEWLMTREGAGKTMGGSADRPADSKARPNPAATECSGFRVVKGAAAPKK
ncbi:MAG: prolyl oligopeptidase family serine peptidase [Candidatus Aminicenantales bacterium]